MSGATGLSSFAILTCIINTFRFEGRRWWAFIYGVTESLWLRESCSSCQEPMTEQPPASRLSGERWGQAFLTTPVTLHHYLLLRFPPHQCKYQFCNAMHPLLFLRHINGTLVLYGDPISSLCRPLPLLFLAHGPLHFLAHQLLLMTQVLKR